MVVIKNFSPVAAAVKAGESGGGGAIPSVSGLFSAAQSNFNNYANHCTNVQAHYAARAGGVDVPVLGENIGANPHFAKMAKAAGAANKFCEQGAVTAGIADSAVSAWIPLLQSSQDTWNDAKEAAENIRLDVHKAADGSTEIDSKQVKEEGEYLRSDVEFVSDKPIPEGASDHAKEVMNRRNDEDAASGKNIKKASKVLLDEATTNFEQSVQTMTSSRSTVVSNHSKAVGALLAAKQKANAKRKDAAEDEMGKINEVLGLVDKAQGAIEKGMGIVKGADQLSLLSDVGGKAAGTKASAVAKFVLQLDGTIPTIEGEITACTTRAGNLQSIINEAGVAGAGAAFVAAVKSFKEALGIMPDRIRKYEAAHEAFAQDVNLALIKRGQLKPGEDGVKGQMQVLAKLRIASAATQAALGATGDVASQVGKLAGMTSIPQPDVCQLGAIVSKHSAAFGSAPGHISAIKAVLAKRGASLKDYVEKMKI